MKCFCCNCCIQTKVYTIEDIKKYGLQIKTKIDLKCKALQKILDFVNHHNIYIYYNEQLGISFMRRCNNLKEKIYEQLLDDIRYIKKYYKICLDPDLTEAYDYFDVICFWFFIKKIPFSHWSRFFMKF